MAPTLHRLLWGPTFGARSLKDWRIRAFETPAVGLPARATAFLFQTLGGEPPAGWHPVNGPLTWKITDDADVLAKGRLGQFGEKLTQDPEAGVPQRPKAGRSSDWEIRPHGAYYLPFAVATDTEEIKEQGYISYCDALLLLTALDGGERILDQIAKSGAGSVDFEDRWSWRSRIHLPREAWEGIQNAVRWSEKPNKETPAGPGLAELLAKWAPNSLCLHDFVSERVDLRLEMSAETEVVRAIRPPGAAHGDLPDELYLQKDSLQDDLRVRIAQVK